MKYKIFFAVIIAFSILLAAFAPLKGITNFDRIYLKDGSSGPILNVNQKGTGDIVRFQDNGSTVWSVADGGAVSVKGAVSNASGAYTITDNVLIDGQTDAIQLVVQGYTTQTNSLLVLENSSGTDKFVVDGSGNVTVMGDFDEAIRVDGEADEVQMTVQGYITQTAKSLVVEQSDGTDKFTVSDDGSVFAAGTSDLRGSVSDGAGALTFADNTMIDGQADAIQLTVQGYTTQTNSLLVLENSSGTDQLAIDGSGNVTKMGDFDEAIIVDGEADEVQLTVSGYTTQTSKSLVVEQSDGTDKFTVGNDGSVFAAGTSDLQGNVSDSAGTFTVADNAAITGQADAEQLVVTGYTTQTNSLLVVEANGGSDIFEVGSSDINANNNPIVNVGAAGTDFGSDGSLTTAQAITVSAGGIGITGNSTVAGTVGVSGQADAIQLTVSGYTTQTNSLLVLENSGGTDKFTVSNDGNGDFSGTLNFGSDDLYPLGYASSGYEIECGTTGTFTGDTTISASALTTVTRVLLAQTTAPITTAAFIYHTAPSTTTVSVISLNSTFGAGTTGTGADYCLIGNQ